MKSLAVVSTTANLVVLPAVLALDLKTRMSPTTEAVPPLGPKPVPSATTAPEPVLYADDT